MSNLQRFFIFANYQKCLILTDFYAIFVTYLYRALNADNVRLIRSYLALIALKCT